MDRPVPHIQTVMRHAAEWNTWLAQAYTALREDVLPEAPPAATVLVSLPQKKRTGQEMTRAEFHANLMQDTEGGFGSENMILIHPTLIDRPLDLLLELVHQMIHASLADAGHTNHGKEFQAIAKKVGLVKPWAIPEADDVLWKRLGQVLDKLGAPAPGMYVPPPPPEKKPSPRVKFFCECAPPREMTLSPKQLERGTLICGACEKRFRTVQEKALARGNEENA